MCGANGSIDAQLLSYKQTAQLTITSRIQVDKKAQQTRLEYIVHRTTLPPNSHLRICTSVRVYTVVVVVIMRLPRRPGTEPAGRQGGLA